MSQKVEEALMVLKAVVQDELDALTRLVVLFQAVVEAVSGILYPAVSEVAPVDELYVRPVAELENRLRMYEGVRAVVEAAAASQEALFAVTVLYVLFQLVVLAVSGMLYPDVKLNTPVEVAYERPVADDERVSRARASVKYRLPFSVMSPVSSTTTPI